MEIFLLNLHTGEWQDLLILISNQNMFPCVHIKQVFECMDVPCDTNQVNNPLQWEILHTANLTEMHAAFPSLLYQLNMFQLMFSRVKRIIYRRKPSGPPASRELLQERFNCYDHCIPLLGSQEKQILESSSGRSLRCNESDITVETHTRVSDY